MARDVQAHGLGGRSAGARNQPEQRPRLGRQRRAVGQTGTGGAEGRGIGDRRPRSGPLRRGAGPAADGSETSIATSSCWPARRRRPARTASSAGSRISTRPSRLPAARISPAACLGRRFDSHQPPVADRSRPAVRRVGQGPGSDRPDGPARAADMGRPGRALARPEDRTHVGRRHHAIVAGRSHGLGMRQAEQIGHRGPFLGDGRETAGRRRAAGRQDGGLDPHRQLGGGLGKLDRRLPRRVPPPPRLRPAALSADAQRPGRRQPGSVRAIPVGSTARRSARCFWRTTPGT